MWPSFVRTSLSRPHRTLSLISFFLFFSFSLLFAVTDTNENSSGENYNLETGYGCKRRGESAELIHFIDCTYKFTRIHTQRNKEICFKDCFRSWQKYLVWTVWNVVVHICVHSLMPSHVRERRVLVSSIQIKIIWNKHIVWCDGWSEWRTVRRNDWRGSQWNLPTNKEIKLKIQVKCEITECMKRNKVVGWTVARVREVERSIFGIFGACEASKTSEEMVLFVNKSGLGEANSKQQQQNLQNNL